MHKRRREIRPEPQALTIDVLKSIYQWAIRRVETTARGTFQRKAAVALKAVALRAQAHGHISSLRFPAQVRGSAAIEEAIFAGVLVNVTLLLSSAQYIAAAEAYLRGIERRIAAGLDPKMRSVPSMFISRWDKVLIGKVPRELEDRLGIAIANALAKPTAIYSLHRGG